MKVLYLGSNKPPIAAIVAAVHVETWGSCSGLIHNKNEFEQFYAKCKYTGYKFLGYDRFNNEIFAFQYERCDISKRLLASFLAICGVNISEYSIINVEGVSLSFVAHA